MVKMLIFINDTPDPNTMSLLSPDDHACVEYARHAHRSQTLKHEHDQIILLRQIQDRYHLKYLKKKTKQRHLMG